MRELVSLSLSLSLISTTAASTGGDMAAFGPVPRQNPGYDLLIVVQVDLTFGDTEILDDDLRKALIQRQLLLYVNCVSRGVMRTEWRRHTACSQYKLSLGTVPQGALHCDLQIDPGIPKADQTGKPRQ